MPTEGVYLLLGEDFIRRFHNLSFRAKNPNLSEYALYKHYQLYQTYKQNKCKPLRRYKH